MSISTYDPKAFAASVLQILKVNVSEETFVWLDNDQLVQNVAKFNAAFVLMPRKTGKHKLKISADQQAELSTLRKGINIVLWTADRLGRVLLLLKYYLENPKENFVHIENLFITAEMNEQVALYSALPILPEPKLWVWRCTEGIRSNLDPVLEAIMYDNPYASENLEELAWNQMVMKAIFTKKRIDFIYGLDERANAELARMLIDFSNERRAAGREVPQGLGDIMEKFADV